MTEDKAVRIRPFGMLCVEGLIGGRLESAVSFDRVEADFETLGNRAEQISIETIVCAVIY